MVIPAVPQSCKQALTGPNPVPKSLTMPGTSGTRTTPTISQASLSQPATPWPSPSLHQARLEAQRRSPTTPPAKQSRIPSATRPVSARYASTMLSGLSRTSTPADRKLPLRTLEPLRSPVRRLSRAGLRLVLRELRFWTLSKAALFSQTARSLGRRVLFASMSNYIDYLAWRRWIETAWLSWHLREKSSRDDFILFRAYFLLGNVWNLNETVYLMTFYCIRNSVNIKLRETRYPIYLLSSFVTPLEY